MPANNKVARTQLLEMLKGGGAHLTFDDGIAKLPPSLRGAKPAGQPHTPWRLLEHMRIAQWDILEFIRDPKHKSPKWPDEYWPQGDGPSTSKDWDNSVKRFHADAKALQRLIADPAADLFAPLPHGDGQSLFREAMLVLDHTAYHLGQLVIVRRMLGTWKD